MNNGKKIGIDHRRMHKKILESIKKSNECAQESGVEISKIKSTLEKIKFGVEIKLIPGHESSSASYSSNQIKYLTKKCDERSRRKRENVELEDRQSDVKYHGNHVLIKNEVVQMRSITAAIRIADAEEEERKHVLRKYGHKEEFIDLDARNAFSVKKATASVIKCANGFNHYGVRHAKINNDMIEAKCPLCNSEETWEHVTKCRETTQLRREFIKKLAVELVNDKPVDVHADLMMSFVEDIATYLEDDEEEDEYETNQHLIGMKELFRGHVVKMWEGTNVNCNKCKVLNKIVVR